MDKSAILAHLLGNLGRELDVLLAAAADSRENATGDEARAEGQYDTRALESSYLAEGQARLVAEVRESIAAYQNLPLRSFAPGEPAALGALLTVETAPGGETMRYFLGPRAGGETVEIEGAEILVITPQSPIGRQLLGRRAGDEIGARPPGPLAGSRVLRIE